MVTPPKRGPRLFVQWHPLAGGENSLGRIGAVALVVWTVAGIVLRYVDIGCAGTPEPMFGGRAIKSTALFFAAPCGAFIVTSYLLATKRSSREARREAATIVLAAWAVFALLTAAIGAFAYWLYEVDGICSG
jgi:hypothetical protein